MINLDNNSFSKRYNILVSLLNSGDYSYNMSDKYPTEYIADLIGFDDIDEFRKCITGEKEPTKEIKERFVEVFGVNRKWMLYGMGIHPFKANIENASSYPMDILRNFRLSEIKEFILVIGKYLQYNHLCVVIKYDDNKYEVYPRAFVLNSHVGATGASQLVDAYRFIRESERIKKLHSVAYNADTEQMQELLLGEIYPKGILRYRHIPSFVDEFLDLNIDSKKLRDSVWDEDLLKVRNIIKEELPSRDKVNQEADERIMQNNLKKERDEKTIAMNGSNHKKKKIFISHAQKDSFIVSEFVELLRYIGIDYENIICSSVPECFIPFGRNIYDWIINLFSEYDLHVMYMFSKNYYKSVASLNEMGAAWAFKCEWDAVLLPGFDYKDIEGCVDDKQIALKLDNKEAKYRLTQLRKKLEDEFDIKRNDEIGWERHRDAFLSKILAEENISIAEGLNEDISASPSASTNVFGPISMDASTLVSYGARDQQNLIIVYNMLSGKRIETCSWKFCDAKDLREEARWLAAIDELLALEFVSTVGNENNIYKVTSKGKGYADSYIDAMKIDVTKAPTEYLI